MERHRTKILLVYPRFRLPTGDPPLGLAYLASTLLAGGKSDVQIHDATFQPSLNALESSIKEFKPDIVGIYVDTSMYADALAAASVAKEAGAFVITGGPHATVMPATLVVASDIVVIGEGEQTMAEIVEHFPERTFHEIPGIAYKQGDSVIWTPPRTFFCDLDTLPFPALTLLDMNAYTERWHYLDCLDIGFRGTNLIGTRGCPFNCSFCQPTLKKLFGNKTRYRSPENIVKEIMHLKQLYGINAFFFHDDTITADKNRMLMLCEQIRQADLNITWACNTRVDTIDREMMAAMHSAGLRKLHIGAESGSQRILDDIYQKNITTEQVRETVLQAGEIGIKCLCFFILGAPNESWRELYQTVRFACSLPIDEASFSILTPLPGTRIRDELLKDSRFVLSSNLSSYNYYSKRAFRDPQLSNFTLKLWQMIALISFYIHYKRWKYIFSHFKNINGIKKLLRKIGRSV